MLRALHAVLLLLGEIGFNYAPCTRLAHKVSVNRILGHRLCKTSPLLHVLRGIHVHKHGLVFRGRCAPAESSKSLGIFVANPNSSYQPGDTIAGLVFRYVPFLVGDQEVTVTIQFKV